MDLNIVLAAVSVVIIIALSFYAGTLINKIKVHKARNLQLEAQKKEQQALKKQQRNDNICESIRFIARATAQKQCNVSEAAIRLTVLLETLLIKQPIDIQEQYPALSAMFDKVKDMPTHDERKKFPVKEIKMLDMRRQIAEAELEDAVIKEALQLETFSI
ncbi:DUF2489 domain-containing protein [Psychromonas ossibalaenae]|uniref:DUF2489 domain-containing protein n=1 Tax=Psychromonas ossibalaenae TaxID=444922 RepID=UPI0003625691|nr:DUF2489 domain-containing protein [Psychromonas ossibalaenae]